ncbi:hypothetical protein [Shewanella salipaludis]|uniref:Cytochrome c domain-containing protein n=1 Tax=Shewanella salipaludis TaxID=2723052 RepID=A0A972FYZ2_9GAMM|nr:hypothetical protein [Shewanella salipaludis]NMH64471.1 hypothetical protein [Shewanella salipaludis]
MKHKLAALLMLSACAFPSLASQPSDMPPASTCTGAYPSYFQDPAFNDTGMWDNQVIINQAYPGWKGPIFRLSDAYSGAKADQAAPWRAFNPFDKSLSESDRHAQARGYLWAVMHYIQEGNIGSGDIDTDWDLCNNPVRSWYHIPYQTYDPLSGREFIHGLTREAPVTMTIADQGDLKTTMWAVGFYNPAAGSSIGTVWTGAPAPELPQQNFQFNEGSVIGKLLFTTATPNNYPFLTNVPVWQANISASEFCSCTGTDGQACSFQQETEQCPRSVADVYLLQFDIAVRDSRSPVGWAYGTFVADGQFKASEKNPWDRISPLGLMWGNDTPPLGSGAAAYPQDPVTGLKDSAIFQDVAGRLNAQTNAGHLGCDSRLNGPADNAQSSCLSCHQTASVPDSGNNTPAIMYQFASYQKKGSGQCMTSPSDFDLAIDQVYFKSFMCSSSFSGPKDIVPAPDYAQGQKQWISTDFSLQLSISLTQWQEWQQDQDKLKNNIKIRRFDGTLPSR